MFKNCYALYDIVLPDSIETISYDTFWNCTSITTFKVPKNVTTIEAWAFEGCSNMRYIVIPDTVTSIQGNSFSGCSTLTNIICYKDLYAATYDAAKATYLGDMNSDKSFDMDDISAILDATISAPSDEIQRILADYNLDGVIDGFDAAALDHDTYSPGISKGDVDQNGIVGEYDHAMLK